MSTLRGARDLPQELLGRLSDSAAAPLDGAVAGFRHDRRLFFVGIEAKVELASRPRWGSTASIEAPMHIFAKRAHSGDCRTRSHGSVAIVAVFVACAIACGKPAANPSRLETSSPVDQPPASPSATCEATKDCLAWDTFDGEPGPIKRAPSGQMWEAWGALFCPTCLPSLTTDGFRASIASGADNIQVWFATLDTDHTTGITVSADITMSPTPLRANVGLVALFVNPGNHLSCRSEYLGSASRRPAHHRRPASRHQHLSVGPTAASRLGEWPDLSLGADGPILACGRVSSV